MKKAAFVVAWLAASVFNRGYLLGAMTMEYPSQRAGPAATAFALLGPFSLPEGVYFAASGAPYMVKELSCQQRWEAFKKEGYEDLGKRYFVHSAGGNYNCREDRLQ